MFYLSLDDVLVLFVEHVGPREALTRPDLLESAVALPRASMFGEDPYPHLFLKAAALLRSIAQNQAFIDGNKRIASIACRVFLGVNGIDVRTSTEKGLALMIELANNEVDVEGIAAFLAEHSSVRADADELGS
jgi:death-on-curing protein